LEVVAEQLGIVLNCSLEKVAEMLVAPQNILDEAFLFTPQQPAFRTKFYPTFQNVRGKLIQATLTSSNRYHNHIAPFRTFC